MWMCGLQLTAALRDHCFGELDSQNMVYNALTSQLGKEAENGRLLRLLVKLSTITERADMDMHWAETG
jgi:PAB-dependent poly(A)-specific ribonuclease subunit 3